MAKFYSNSVSFGVRDAVNAGIQAEDLIIVAGTCFESKEQGIEYYGKSYWSGENHDKEVAMFSELWDMGHIVQPRAIYGGFTAPYCGCGNHIYNSIEEMYLDCEDNVRLYTRLIADGHLA